MRPASPRPDPDCPSSAGATRLVDGETRAATLHTAEQQDTYLIEVEQAFTNVSVVIPGSSDLRVVLSLACDVPGRVIGSGSGRQIGDSEEVETNIGLRTGKYIATVSARSSAIQVPRSYAIQLRLTPINPDTTRSLILSSASRMAELWGEEGQGPELVQWRADLRQLARHPEVNGILVEDIRYDASAEVERTYDAWLADASDPLRANDVVRAIRNWINDVVKVLPNVRYIVIAGDDRVVPHYRLPIVDDEELVTGWLRESVFIASGEVDPASTVGSALSRDYTLTDDAYAARLPVSWRDGHSLWVPELAVGRLVERPSDMSVAARAFIERNGEVVVQRSVTAGYDFMQDGVEAVDEWLAEAGIPDERRVQVLGDEMSGANLVAELLASRKDVAFIGAHASHRRFMLPGSDEVDAQDVLDAPETLDGMVAYGLACHAGLNAPGSGHPFGLDFAEAWQRRGATWIGSTGWAYGMEGALGYQEALTAEFARILVAIGGAGLGDALVEAKRAYYLGNEMSPMHVKTLAATVLYGFPMLRVRFVDALHGGVGDSDPVDNWAPVSQQIAVHDRHTLEESVDIFRQAPALHVERSQAIEFASTSLVRRDDPAARGSYFTFGTIRPRANAGEPLQPRELRELGRIERDQVQYEPRGVVVVGGAYREVPEFTPVVQPAGIINGRSTSIEGLARLSQSAAFDVKHWYPRIPMTLRRLPAWEHGVGRAMLQTTVGQYHAESRTERLLERVVFDAYYSSSPDLVGPEVGEVDVRTQEDGVELVLHAGDASSVIRAVVAFATGDGFWRSVELSSTGDGYWSGEWPRSDTHFVQVVDAAGNVTTVDEAHRVWQPCVGLCDEEALSQPQ